MRRLCFLVTFILTTSKIISQIVYTISGGGSILSNISATAAVLNQPSGVAIDANNNVYFTDPAYSIVRKISSNGIITTFAGMGLYGYTGDGGQASQAKMAGPIGIVRDNFGNTYIADAAENVIRKVSATGIISTFAGTGIAGFSGDGGAAVLAKFNYPQGLAIDQAQNIYVCDNLNHRIRKITPSGIITTIAGNGFAGFSGDGGLASSASLKEPFGVHVDKNNIIYIADSRNYRIRKINSSGIISTILGNGLPFSTGDGGMATAASGVPVDIKTDTIGNLFFTDFAGNKIRKINLIGVVSLYAGNGFAGFSGDNGPAINASLNFPRGMIIKNNGTIIFADGQNNRIRKIDTLGKITTIAGTTPPAYTYPTTQLTLPTGVAINRFNGNVYYNDYFGYQVRKIDLSSGLMNTIAGTGVRGFSGDNGPAINAQLDTIIGIFSDSSGVYFCDAGNHRIRKINKQGIISTVVGNGTAGYSGDGGLAINAEIDFPNDLTIYNNNLYFTDDRKPYVRKVDLSSGIITKIGGNGSYNYSGDGGLAVNASVGFCSSITHDASGNIYISDNAYHVIRKIDPSNIITRIAGTGFAGFSGDNGLASLAKLYAPNGLCCDASGNIYFYDGGNERIRKINSAGIITTYGGNGVTGFSGDGGSALNAQFHTVLSLDVDANSNSLLVGDQGNLRLRMISNIPQPDICMVSTDSTSTYNEIAWDKTNYFNVDSFIVYREVQSSPSIYAKIGAVKSNALSEFNDTNRVLFSNKNLPNGDPNISTYRYKIKIRDNQNNFSDYSKFHNSVYFSFNAGQFTWNNYLIEPSTNPVTGFNLLRDNNSNGNWTIIGSTSGSQTNLIDPNYLNYPNGNWRVDALGFNCNVTQRLNSSYLATKTKTKSNNANDRKMGINTPYLNDNLIELYPVPCKDYLNVHLKNQTNENFTIEINNLLGESIYFGVLNSNNPLIIQTNNYNKGIFIVNIKKENRLISAKKIIIN